MSDKRTTRDMGELLQDSTYAGIRVPVVPDLEWRILKTIESSPERFDMGEWINECGTVACLAGHSCLIAESLGFDLVPQAYEANQGHRAPGKSAAYWWASEEVAEAMWAAIGKRHPDFSASDDEGNCRNEEALADLRARVAADLGGAGGQG